MRRRYVRVPPEKKDTVAAALVSGAVAACVGAVTFYLTRMLLSREELGPRGALGPGDEEALLPEGNDVEQGRGHE